MMNIYINYIYIHIIKISEIDCKTPDQVRFIIRINQQNINYNNSADQNIISISLNIFMIFIFRMFM